MVVVAYESDLAPPTRHVSTSCGTYAISTSVDAESEKTSAAPSVGWVHGPARAREARPSALDGGAARVRLRVRLRSASAGNAAGASVGAEVAPPAMRPSFDVMMAATTTALTRRR